MTTLPAPRALLLDVDGTIADTLPHIFEAFRHAIAPWTDRRWSDAEVEATFGPAERACIASMVPDADLDEAERRFFAFYEDGHATGVTLFAGIIALIQRTKALGWKVGIVTGKGRRSAEFTLRELGLWDQIDVLVSNDDVARGKPDPEGILVASQALGMPPDRLLMVGDMPADVLAGRAAGAATAAVTWAAFRPDELLATAPDFTCGRVEELCAVVEQLHEESTQPG